MSAKRAYEMGMINKVTSSISTTITCFSTRSNYVRSPVLTIIIL